MENQETTAEIYDWYVSAFQSDLFFNNPQKQKPCLVGRIRNHKLVTDGTFFKTSIVVKFDKSNRLVVTDQNTCYKLGNPIENYLEFYPQAEEDFIA